MACLPTGDKQLQELVTAARRVGSDTIIQTVSVSDSTVGNITQVGKRSPK